MNTLILLAILFLLSPSKPASRVKDVVQKGAFQFPLSSPIPMTGHFFRAAPGLEENKGQVRDQHYKPRPDVLFTTKTGELFVHLRETGLSYQQVVVQESGVDKPALTKYLKDQKGVADSHNSFIIYRVDLNFLNSQRPTSIEKWHPQPGYNNYYNVPQGAPPALFVRTYERVVCRNVWPGVDLILSAGREGFKYEWWVANPEDHRRIAFQVKGARPSVEGLYLALSTPHGTIREGALKAYQGGREVPVRWKVTGEKVEVELVSYKPGVPLVIDPPVRLWSTYYGGSSSDNFYSCSTDPSGQVVAAAGRTSSFQNIATTGAHQTAPISPQSTPDAMLVKFTPDGIRLWGTYFGGENNDFALSCAVDGQGYLTITGATLSTTNIASSGAHQTAFGGGPFTDGFIARFNDAGVLQWSTYYGGTGVEDAYACVVDQIGNIYVGGYSSVATPSTVIATSGTHQSVNNGMQDAYLVKFSPSGVRLWGTYLGGTANDRCFALTRDSQGNLYMSGLTASQNGTNQAIATSGTHALNLIGSEDAFLVKFTPDGQRVWGTYFGGPQNEHGYSCSVDAQSNVYLAGNTNSSTGGNIGTSGAHQVFYGGGFRDGFLAKFNSLGQLSWSTYFGGDADEFAYSCVADQSGGVFLCGYTESQSSIATNNAYQATLSGMKDAFIVRFNGLNGTLDYGSYYGGTQEDMVMGACLDPANALYVAGSTNSLNVMGSSNSHQDNLGNGPGISDGFLSKFCSQVSTYFADSDGDGFGNGSVSLSACAAPPGYALNGLDCDDNNHQIHPNAPEICNYQDDNCNQQTDEGVLLTFYLDNDGDGFGDTLLDTLDCSSPQGYVAQGGDCNDTLASIHPGATEICNQIDDNCNGQIDEGCTSVPGGSDDNHSSIHLFPNPFTEYFFIDIKFSQAPQEGALSIFNVCGQLIENSPLKFNDQKILYFGHQLPAGIYLLKLQAADRIFDLKVIKIVK